MRFLKKVFKYFEPAWTGNDHKVSLRSLLAIAFSLDFIRNLSYAVTKWDAGRSLEGLSLTLGIEAGLIVALLGLKTYQNMSLSNPNKAGDDNDIDETPPRRRSTIEQSGDIR